MIFNAHSDLKGKHAFLSASKYHWVRYDEKRMAEVFRNSLAAERGTKLHELACQCIRLGVRLPRNRKTLNLYVNDAIGFGMTPEVLLYYSKNCFGTADAIAYDRGLLRIHDLKTGEYPGNMDQLLVYAALFALEYGVTPEQIELRIYQSDDIQIATPTQADIKIVKDKIVAFDKLILQIRAEEGLELG